MPRIVAVAQLLFEFYEVIDAEGMHMQDAAICRIARIGRQICQCYSQLARAAADSREKMWKASPKFHIFLHLCEWQIPDNGFVCMCCSL